MVPRIVLIAAVAVLAVLVIRRVAGPGVRNVFADPRLRVLLAGVSLQMLRAAFLRRGVPWLMGLLRTFRFFR